MGPRQTRAAQHRDVLSPGRLYEQIGGGYTRHRHPDPRIAAPINQALAGARRIVNVGAGAGSYEPTDRDLVAVEPSTVMLAQRPAHAAPAVRGLAEALPCPDRAFDAALAVLTLQHWTDAPAGLQELRRVARHQVVLHYEPGHPWWLTDEYLPQLRDVDVGHVMTVPAVVAALDGGHVTTITVPHDCVDGFFAAYWRRPEAYLDRSVRDAISMFARIPDAAVQPGLARLAADLDSGAWHARHAELLDRDDLDVGYRLIVAG